MKKSPSSLLHLKVIFLTLLFIFSYAFSQEKISIRDSLGTLFEFKSPPSKIVSLSPAITEILFFIGAGEKVAGVTRFCNFPSEAQKKEIVGGLLDIDIEKILKINPDIVVATRGNPINLIIRMKSLGINVFAIDIKDSIEDIFSAMEKISILTGNHKVAMVEIHKLRKRAKLIERKAKKAKSRPKVFIQLGHEQLWTCGKRTYLNDLISKAGCKNIGDFREGWFIISIEKLINQNPDLIIMLSKDKEEFYSSKKKLLSIPGVSNLNAVKYDSIYQIENDIMERPGPRIVDALEEIYEISHRRKK